MHNTPVDPPGLTGDTSGGYHGILFPASLAFPPLRPVASLGPPDPSTPTGSMSINTLRSRRTGSLFTGTPASRLPNSRPTSAPRAGAAKGSSSPTGTITAGAYREDCEDPVYHYGDVVGPLDNAYFSASHFWDADAGDGSTIDICDLTCGSYQNAYRKSLRYVLPGSYGRWTAKLTWPAGIASFYLQAGGTGSIFHNGLIGFEYDSLAAFYRDGRCSITGYMDITGRWQTPSTVPDRLPLKIIAPKNVRDRIVWEVIGRITHLLGDMGVPAHAHNDIHPPFWWNNEPADTFEEEMARLYTAWDHLDAVAQGHLLDAGQASPGGGAERAMRYFFYTTNQVADRFPSNDNDGDSRFDRSWEGDDYSVLGIIDEVRTAPAAGDIFYPEAADYAFVFSIRAIAGLYHWFASETGILATVTVDADFEGATLIVDGKPRATPVVMTLPAGTPFTIEARDQTVTNPATNCPVSRKFKDWERHRLSTGVSYTADRLLSGSAVGGDRYLARFDRSVILPGLPGALSPSPGTAGVGPSVQLTWECASDAETYGIQVSRSAFFSAPLVLDRIGITGQSSVISNLDPGTTYFWRVRGVNSLGDGGHSAASSFSTSYPPAAPLLAGAVATIGSSRYPRLSWSSPAGTTSFRVFRYLCGEADDCLAAAGRPALIYQGTSTTFTDLGTVVTAKSLATRVYYFVRGTANGFASAPSNAVSYGTRENIVWGESVEDHPLPAMSGLGENYPNPFNPSTTIPFALSSAGEVTLSVYNLLGQRVALLVEGTREAGFHEVSWSAADLPAGVYILVMDFTGAVSGEPLRDRRKIILLK